jgi:hypothetical protein
MTSTTTKTSHSRYERWNSLLVNMFTVGLTWQLFLKFSRKARLAFRTKILARLRKTHKKIS